MSDEVYTGEIRIFTGNFAPDGWAICDGSHLPISDYQALFSLIGTTYGGDGQKTFALPDLRGRMPIDIGKGDGLTERTLGEKGGEEEVNLTVDQIPHHKHSPITTIRWGDSDTCAGNFWASSKNASQYAAPQTVNTTMDSRAIGPTGKNQAHDNMPPFLPVNFIIALGGNAPQN